MDFKAFSLKVILLTSGILLSLVLLTKSWIAGTYQMVLVLLLCNTLVLCYLLLRTITSTNTELSKFLEAARHADFAQRFDMTGMGAGFTELGATFDQILQQFQSDRASQDAKLKHLKAVIENVPVALLSIHSDQRVTLWNNVARRLFGNHIVQHFTELNTLGSNVQDVLALAMKGKNSFCNYSSMA